MAAALFSLCGGLSFRRKGPLPAGAAAIALVSDSHLRHLPELTEPSEMEWSVNVSRERARTPPCPIERQAGRAPHARRQKGRRIRPPAGDRCAVVTPAAGLHPRHASPPADWRSGSAIAPSWSSQSRWTWMPTDPSFDQGSTVCVMTVRLPLARGSTGATAHLSLAAGPAAGAPCDHIGPCRCEAGEAAHYGAAAARRRSKLAAATDEPRSDCCTVPSLCGITRSWASLKASYGAATALYARA